MNNTVKDLLSQHESCLQDDRKNHGRTGNNINLLAFKIAVIRNLMAAYNNNLKNLQEISKCNKSTLIFK